jgi:hypothetical protein
MTPDDPWLAAVWPFIRTELPPTPATVLEMGCGSMGGFVPALPRARTTSGSRWWRRCHCITWPSWTRPSTSSRRCWCQAACWWSWSGPGSDSTRPPPVVLRPADITRPRGRTRLAAQAPGAMGRFRETLGWLPAELGHRGSGAPRRGDPAGLGCAVRPPTMWRLRTSSPTSPIRATEEQAVADTTRPAASGSPASRCQISAGRPGSGLVGGGLGEQRSAARPPRLRPERRRVCSAECWLGASSLSGRLGAVRSGAATVRHGAGCDSWSSSLTPFPPVAWSGSAVFTWG